MKDLMQYSSKVSTKLHTDHCLLSNRQCRCRGAGKSMLESHNVNEFAFTSNDNNENKNKVNNICQLLS